ncbi:hypothetical protein [[Limnothrix rosea] IAM M-220]|uniref:hypothetical protein n=1 Tax=[Limnothrix rosea] IAM M-220 TaxID=454133 RepID=UPI000968C3BD|nr:hypothetical protein [[Limnothrix rosea] IAM M-220]OKH19923.1 hypothetical protein NIES208_00110 [[Limnothrix rosea] IAM M-220]
MQSLSTSTLLTALIVPGLVTPAVAIPVASNSEFLPSPLLFAQVESRVEDGSVADTDGVSAVKILSPTMGAVLKSNSSAVVIEAPIGSQVTLQVNGRPIDANQVGQLQTDSAQGIVRQTWFGVIFKDGDNILTAIATKDGETTTDEITLQAPGMIADLRLTTVEQRVPADGRSTVTVQGFLLDDNGNISNRGGLITLVSSSGEFVGVDAEPDAEGFQVDAKDGQFEATLQSSLESGTVQIRADLLGLEAFTQVQFETALRPSLLTGVIDVRIGAENTNYYGSFSEFLDPDSDGKTVIDVDGAAFAIGAVGDWLLTAAFNGDRPLNEACETCTNRLYRADQKSEEPYPTYGDESTVSNLTPSQDQLFIRFERSPGILNADPDYIMWGDYSTRREFANASQEFSALSRQLHGAKLNYNLGDLQISGLFSQGGESFQRDTLLPDGTTGFYFLTQRFVVPGSEEIYVELEELERPGTVLQRDRLQRGIDYDIDYDRGSVVFTDPMLRTEFSDEGALLVRRIVASYQHETDSDNKLYAGRLRYNFSRETGAESWLGTTYFHEDKGERDLEVFGVDSQISFGKNYLFTGEYARSTNDSTELGNVSGSAYRLDFIGQFSDNISGRAYYRHADTEFANESTISFVPGQTRYGAELDAKISNSTQLRFKYDHENNDGVNIRPIVTLGDLLAADDEAIADGFVDNSLTTISGGLLQKIGKSNLTLDLIYRDREDRINPDNSGNSTQLRSRFTTPLRDNLRFSISNETTLSGDTDAVYNDRTQVGFDWKILSGVNLGLKQNWYTRGSLAGQSTTSIDLGGQYQLWKNAVFTGRYRFENFSTGIEDSLGFGIRQRWTVFPGFHVDAAYEKVVGNLFFGGDGSVSQGGSRSTRVRDGDSLSLRASYTDNPNFKAEALYEWRNTNGGQTSNVSASLLGKVSPSLTTLFNIDRRFAAGKATRDLPASTDIRLGLAYRNPYSDKFNALVKYEYRHNPDTIPETLLLGTGNSLREHIFAGEMIYAPNWQWEFYSKLAYRHSSIDLADNFSASSSLGLAQVRARYQMNRWVDLTFGGRWIRQFSAGYDEMGWLGEVGFHPTPNLRLAVGYSSGEINQDRDFDGTRADSGLYAAATLKLDRLFGGFGLQEPLPTPQVRRQLMVENTEAEEDITLQAALPSQPLRLNVSQTIEFSPNATSMSRKGQVVLDSLITVMHQYPDLNIDIQGELPPLAELTPDNIEAQRLQTARKYLLSKGIQGNRIVIRSLGQMARNTVQEQREDRLVGFALIGSAETFELLSSQLSSEFVGTLLGEGLPSLAARQAELEENIVAVNPVVSEVVEQASTNVEEPEGLETTAVVPRNFDDDPLFSFAPLAVPSEGLGDILVREATLDREARDMLLGDRRVDEAENITEDFFTTEVRPEEELILGDRRIPNDETDLTFFNTDQWMNMDMLTLTSVNLDLTDGFANGLILSQLPESEAMTVRDFSFFTDDRDTLALAPTDVTEDTVAQLSYLEARQLESALSFLLGRDVETLDTILEATAQQQELRGEVIDFDRLMNQSNDLGGQL